MKLLVDGTYTVLLDVLEIERYDDRRFRVNKEYWITLPENSNITSMDVLNTLYTQGNMRLSNVSIGDKPVLNTVL